MLRSLLTFSLHVLQIVQLILEYLRDRRLREEGRKEIKQEIKKSHEEAEQAAKAAEDYVRNSSLDDLRERMRDYKRPRDGPT